MPEPSTQGRQDQARTLVLVGGGHAHLQVVKELKEGAFLFPVKMIIISENQNTMYHGMIPGAIAGLYAETEIGIDLEKLSRYTGWTHIQERVESIDPETKTIVTTQGTEIKYDVMSINIGALSRGVEQQGVREFAIPSRPIDRVVPRIQDFETRYTGKKPRVVVIGSGAAGVEIAFGLHARFMTKYGDVTVTLAGRARVPLENAQSSVHAAVLQGMATKGIAHVGEFEAKRVDDSKVYAADGRVLSFDVLLWSPGVVPDNLPRRAGFALSPKGFLQVNKYLQSVSHPDVFGAGDCISFQEYGDSFPPKAGVYSVREGPYLRENLYHRLVSPLDPTTLKPYTPQSDFLSLLMTGDKSAIGTKYGVTFQGPWVWHLKDRIDSDWMTSFDVDFLLEHGSVCQRRERDVARGREQSVDPSQTCTPDIDTVPRWLWWRLALTVQVGWVVNLIRSMFTWPFAGK